MGRMANTALATQWRERIERWRGSPWTIDEFCRREAVSQASFYQWRRRLKVAVNQPRRPRKSGSASPGARFVELPSPGWSPMEGIQIALPGGAIVTLPPQAAAELLTAAIRAALPALEAGPC